MAPPVICLSDVWKSYGKVTAVRGIRLNVPAQGVYGFLGPNGAGKTTTIRLILGLHQPDSGSINLFEQPLATERLSVLRRVGSLVDTPSLYTHLSGRENLEVHRRLLNVPKSFIDDALASVNLAVVADRIVRNYSHGMRQRLGVALALLGQPELLILDEPTNGLDPAGIHEMRALVRDLPKNRGVTVFLSSHLLSEVEQVATHVAILSQGEIQFEGTPQDLKMRNQVIVVHVDQEERAIGVLESAGLAIRHEGQRFVIRPQRGIGAAEVNAMLVQARVSVSHLVVEGASLEDVFLQLTRDLSETVEVPQ